MFGAVISIMSDEFVSLLLKSNSCVSPLKAKDVKAALPVDEPKIHSVILITEMLFMVHPQEVPLLHL